MRLLLILVLLSHVINATAQKNKKNTALSGFHPVQVNGKTLYVAETETTTAQWVDYVKYLSENDGITPADSALVPNRFNRCVSQMFMDRKANYRDTTYKDSKGRNMLSQVQCGRMPITGISYEQATRYCDYLNSKWGAAEIPIKVGKNYINVVFRLATPEEYLAIHEQSKLPPKEMASGINEHGCILLNYKHNSWCESNLRLKEQFGYAVPMPVMTFFPDNVALWDVFGNVAEMTSEKGVAMGGSSIHGIAGCQPGVRNIYEGPSYWLGFRVVAEVKSLQD
jgi:formylglycine-generating enzyme required for sulfatase activity